MQETKFTKSISSTTKFANQHKGLYDLITDNPVLSTDKRKKKKTANRYSVKEENVMSLDLYIVIVFYYSFVFEYFLLFPFIISCVSWLLSCIIFTH